jgi:adenylate cyclase
MCRASQRANGLENLWDQQVLETVALAKQAVDSGKNDPDVLWMAGWAISYLAGDHTTGLSLIERALTLNPNSALAWNARGYVLVFANRPDPAIESLKHPIRLSPLDPLGYLFKGGLVIANMAAGR